MVGEKLEKYEQFEDCHKTDMLLFKMLMDCADDTGPKWEIDGVVYLGGDADVAARDIRERFGIALNDAAGSTRAFQGVRLSCIMALLDANLDCLQRVRMSRRLCRRESE